ncbi:hypothetical protein Ari01nite_87380 [Paractinoplanes rishiriensis]|uniref:Uncharacterized protein n=1 Tax=Paractinoplanes rishiriensis TaxID=1050105 RepID=A0A919MZA7_9ACTN|nr:hypothetical protein Ari01nite_87380 [Actinoplanes rishiriensis]
MSTLPSRKDPVPPTREPLTDAPDSAAARPAETDTGAHAPRADQQAVVSRQKERYGGIKWGSAFFGWLTATGASVILTGLLLAVGTAVGLAAAEDISDAQGQTGQNAGELGLAGAISLLVVLLIAYYCGGYVAGRMARFNGLRQGAAVWIWAVVITAAIAIATAALGDKYNVLDRVGGFPQLPVSSDDATTGAIIALALALVAALIGAILGGLAGMRFHRKVDRAGLDR